MGIDPELSRALWICAWIGLKYGIAYSPDKRYHFASTAAQRLRTSLITVECVPSPRVQAPSAAQLD